MYIRENLSNSIVLLSGPYKFFEISGPPGCLQYFTGRTGTVSNFGSVANLASTTALTADTTHLANQDYTICFRRYGSCARNCYAPRAAGTVGVIDQDAFGLS